MPSSKAAKRARQKAGRRARMVELQSAQKKRSRIRRSLVAALVILAAVGLAYYTVGSGGSKKAATTTTTTKAAAATRYAGLVARTAPPRSADCDTPASGPVGSGAKAASGRAVSIVPAPQHVPFPNLDGSSPRYTKFSSAPPFCIDASKSYTATVKTDVGTFTILLLPKYAPVTVNNFVFLAGYHFYDGIYFHRVIPGFMDQVGDPTATGGSGPGYTIPDEYPSSNAAFVTGAVAMANTGQPNSGGSQIFITVPGGGAQLAPTYSVFGEVTTGMNVVEKINSDGSSGAGTPKVYHHIISVSITES